MKTCSKCGKELALSKFPPDRRARDGRQSDVTPLPTYCPVFGVELQIGGDHAYSLDRIDNSKGYVPGNVAVVSYLANRLKNDGTAWQHRKIAEWMERQR